MPTIYPSDSMIEAATRLNNEGIAFLADGNDQMATPKLTTALFLMKQYLAAYQKSVKSSQTGRRNNRRSASIPQLPSLATDIFIPLGKVQKGSRDNLKFQHAKYAIYDTPLLFTPAACQIQKRCKTRTEHEDMTHATISTLRTIRLYLACIVFNLALVLHRQSDTFVHGETQFTSRFKAEQMYKTMLQLLDSKKQFRKKKDLSRTSPTFHFLKILATNNLAQLYHENCQYKESGHYISILSKHILQDNGNQARENRFQRGYKEFLSHSELHTLIMNVLRWTPKELAPAA